MTENEGWGKIPPGVRNVPKEDPTYCPNCGTPNADEARFCVNCGRPLQTAAAPPPPAYPAAPVAVPRPAGAADSIRLLGFIVFGLSILIILGFFLMGWIWDGGWGVLSGWDIFNQLVLSDVGGYFKELGEMFQAIPEGYPWAEFAGWVIVGLLWLVPLSALVTGLYGLSFIATPQTVRKVRAKVLVISVALLVLGVPLVTAAIAGLIRPLELEYGFWVTLAGSGVLFLVGLFGVGALVPPQQR
ncbi:MAG: zinc-ribbon domain-containing protein [Chloroflexia bacterium]